jgi:hypothetical protein
MEYKPPLDNQFKRKNRFLYCSLNANNEWICKRCKSIEDNEKDENTCEPPIPIFQSKETKLIPISNHLPEFFDYLIMFQKVSYKSKLE